jgi:hypothetical protein
MGVISTSSDGGSRVYIDADLPLVTVPGVTSIRDMLPKTFLRYWYAQMAARYAVDNISFLAPMIEADPEAAVNAIKGAAQRHTNARGKIGTECHDLFERMLRGEAIGRIKPDLSPYRRHFDEFLETVQPELISVEEVSWSDQYMYAGSPDAILRIRLDEQNRPSQSGELVTVIFDWKTGKDLHSDVALQLAAYAHGDRLIDAAGESRPMPDIEMGAALHITADGWDLRPVAIGPEVFDAFLALRRVFDWERSGQTVVIGKSIAGSTDRIVTGTQRRGSL